MLKNALKSWTNGAGSFIRWVHTGLRSSGNGILKTLDAPWGVSCPCAIRTAPTPVGSVFKRFGDALNWWASLVVPSPTTSAASMFLALAIRWVVFWVSLVPRHRDRNSAESGSLMLRTILVAALSVMRFKKPFETSITSPILCCEKWRANPAELA